MRWRVAAGLGLLALGFGSWKLWRETLPVVPLASGNELRVLKVSVGKRHFYSEEKGWRRFAIERFSEKFVARLGLAKREFVRPHGELVLWMTEIDSKRSENIQPQIDYGFVDFGAERWAPGIVTAISSNVLQIEFAIYPRSNKEITARIVHAGEQVLMKLKNPEPVSLRRWQGRGLPQTNATGKTLVILKGETRGPLFPRAQGKNGEAVGWMQFRIEVEDTAGNWEEFKISNGGAFRELTGRTYQPGPLKLTVHPIEFLSAGYVTNRNPATVQEMKFDERAVELGLEKLYFLGAGNYLFTNGIPAIQTKSPTSTNMAVATTNYGSNWDAHIAPERPTLAALYSLPADVEAFDGRLRERTRRGNGGSVFQPYRPPVESLSFPPARLLRVFDIPAFNSTNPIEAEAIARHRPVEFLIDARNRN
jgi:hypothetical protein